MSENQGKLQEQLAKIERAVTAQEALRGVLTDEEIETAVMKLRVKQAAICSTKLEGPNAIAQDHSMSVVSGVGVGGNVGGGIIQGDHNLYLGSVETLTIQSLIFQAARAPGEVDPRHLLLNYLNRVVNDTAALDLSGIDKKLISDKEEARLELSAVYIALDTMRSVSRLESKTERDVEQLEMTLFTSEQTWESALRFVNDAKYTVLLGNRGSGKTTFVNFLALCLVGELLGLDSTNLRRLGEDWQLGAMLPIRVVLRDFAIQLPCDGENPLWDYIVLRLGESLKGFAPLLNQYILEEDGLLILDGLDEVPESKDRRDQVKQAIQIFKRAYPRVRILLTSRTYAYQRQQWRLPGFTDALLAPFSSEQIERFVERWYEHIAQIRTNLTTESAKGRALLLNNAIKRTPHLRELAPRPLLLTLMASLHAWRGGSLPEQREALYHESVDLLLDFWERPKVVQDVAGQTLVQTESAAEWFRTSRDRVQREFERLTYEAHRDQPDLIGTADISEASLVAAMLRASDDPDMKTARVVEYIRDRAGLLANKGEGVYCFPHRTFQEYLAARHLTRARYPKLLVELVRGDVERWREVVLLAGAKAARGAPHSAWSLVGRLCPSDCTSTKATNACQIDWWMALLAGRVLFETGIYKFEELDELEQGTLNHVRNWLSTLLVDGHLSPVDRASAGVVLSKFDDPRPGVGLKDDSPDIVWSELIKPSPFSMGNTKKTDEMAYELEGPQFECNLIERPYHISRYPITVAQYRVFLEAGGYDREAYWLDAAADDYWKNGEVRVRTWDIDLREHKNEWVSAPADYTTPFNLDNHPQIGVSWYEAVAFCHWLSEQTGQKVSLPTEAQWERAARHTDGRRYPWGKNQSKEHCNMDDTGIGTTCAVGIFPHGDAICGAADMSGNVWEWCNTNWQENYQNYEQEVDDILDDDHNRVVRGGAFFAKERDVRSAFRLGRSPLSRYKYIGFRITYSP